MTRMRSMLLMRSCRQEPYPERQSSAPARSSRSWSRASVVFTEEQSAIWILREIWTPASRFVWPTKRTVRSASVPEPGSWQTACRKRNSRSAATKRGAVRTGYQAGRGGNGMILLIDNYDSFSYNLYQLIGSVYPDIRVIRNDDWITVEEIEAMQPAAHDPLTGAGAAGGCGHLHSGGAGTLQESFRSLASASGIRRSARRYGGNGHLCKAADARQSKSRSVRAMENRTLCRHAGDDFWQRGIIRWRQRRKRLPAELKVTAESEDGEIMAVEHRNDPIFGRAVPSGIRS